MSISQITHRIAQSMHERHDARELQRAIDSAPTPASRQELEILARR